MAWTERGNSVLHDLTCSQLADNVRNLNVRVQEPFDVTGTWISTRYDIGLQQPMSTQRVHTLPKNKIKLFPDLSVHIHIYTVQLLQLESA